MSNRRDQVMSTVVQRYRSHPIVEQAIQNQKTSDYLPKYNAEYSIGNFLAEAGTYALLSKEDEQELFGYIEAGYNLYEALGGLNAVTPEQKEIFILMTAAQQVVYHTNLRLVFSTAKSYLNFNSGGIDAVDHIQEGVSGLSLAINRFDKDKGFKFSTYATQWIRQGITRAIGDKSRTIRLPIHKHETYVKTKIKVDNYARNLGRYLTTKEIEHASGLSYDKYTELMRVGSPNLASLDALLPHSNDMELGSLVGYDHMNKAIGDFSDREELAKIVSNSRLTDKQKIIIGLRFGIEPEIFGNPMVKIDGRNITYADLTKNMIDSNGMKLEEVGEIFGLTRERIRQVQKKALEILQQAASGQKGERTV